MKRNKPNFIIIGAMKSGTTSLYSYLRQHPNIFISSVKEPMFFNNFGQENNYYTKGRSLNKIKTLDEYYKLFDGVKNETAIGEASTGYIYNYKCPSIIKQHIPDVKIIAVLRQPALRAYSNYLHNIRSGKEPVKKFEEALNKEEKRIKENWSPGYHYKKKGLYYTQLSRYYKNFPKENIHIIIFEEFIKDPNKTIKEIFNFLNIDPSFNVKYDFIKNKSGIPRGIFGWIVKKARLYNIIPKIEFSNYLSQKTISIIFKSIYKKPDKLSDKIKNHLTETYFKEDILKLENLIKKDLSIWL